MTEEHLEKIIHILRSIEEAVTSIAIDLHEKNMMMRSVMGGPEAENLMKLLSLDGEEDGEME